jgi:hypothetical protein
MMERHATPYGPLFVLTESEAMARIDAAGLLHCIPWPGAFATLLAPEPGGSEYAVQLKVDGRVEYMDADADLNRLLARFTDDLRERTPTPYRMAEAAD